MPEEIDDPWDDADSVWESHAKEAVESAWESADFDDVRGVIEIFDSDDRRLVTECKNLEAFHSGVCRTEAWSRCLKNGAAHAER